MRFANRAGLGAFALSLLAATAAESADPYFHSQFFSGSGTCASCHNGLYDEQGDDVSIESDWSASMMANASRNPLWQAKFASELLRNPELGSILNEKCTRCHAPMANEEARKNSRGIHFFNRGFGDPGNPSYDMAMDGVSCTVCHQIADENLGTPQGTSGNFTIEEFTNPDSRPAYGSYTNPRINPMQRQSGFTPKYGSHISNSALCASCHDLTTPILDGDGNLVSTTPDTEFPEQMIYSEWENSVYAGDGDEAETCQTCHLALTHGVKISNRPRNLASRDNFSRHTFYGGNTLMLDILDTNRSALDVGNVDFTEAMAATRETLRSAAEIEILETQLDGDVLTARIRVTNHSGHKFPSGFPSRRAYIHLQVTDEAGNILFESGRMNADGSIQGVDSDAAASAYEPHYQQITSAEQVQVYEPIMGNNDGNQTYTLLQAAAYLKDNRVPPKGFRKSEVSGQIAVMGLAMDDPDFDDGSDLVTYRVQMPRVEAARVSVKLKYQSLAFGFLADLSRDAQDPTVSRFLEMYAESPERGETIAEADADAVQIDDGNGDGSGSVVADLALTELDVPRSISSRAAAPRTAQIAATACNETSDTTVAGSITVNGVPAMQGIPTETFTASFAELQGGGCVTPTFTWTAPNQGTSVSWTAEVLPVATGTDPDPGNNTLTARTLVYPLR